MRPARFSQVSIEEVAAYWNARPCNVRHSSRTIGSREYFDEVEARKYFVEPHIPAFAEFPRWNGRKVLEIGCGIGTDTMNFARSNAHVTAVDVSERSLDIARRRAAVYGLSDRIRFVLADAEQLTSAVTREPYDLVYAFGVIHHTPRPMQVIDQIRQYMGSGSTLKLMVYHRRSWKVLGILLRHVATAAWARDDVIARHSEAATGCPVTYTYSVRDVRRLLSGFRIESVHIDHIFPYRVPDYVQHRYVKTWYFRVMPDRLFRSIERRFGWHLCVTASAL
jgi:2-polyprenyl-3-methyl-5-hydroxy-6-metoxy-1,4-benzoquinol methylase